MDRLSPFDRPIAWLQAAALARVVALDDPDHRNRVQIRMLGPDGTGSDNLLLWARVVSAFAGDGRGAFFLPDVDDEVLVLFHNGDTRFPLIVGGLWNGSAAAPADTQSGGINRYKRITSKNGVQITLDDQQGQEKLILETPGGQVFTLSDGPGQVSIEDSNGNTVKMESSGITITASAKVTVQASQVQVSAGMVTVDAGMSKFSGVVQCDTLISNSVVSASYTPGAGNVW